MNPPGVTALLVRWKSGDSDAFNELTPVIYNELRRLAAAQLRRERPGHTLQCTALVHEAYLRLADQTSVPFETRDHFFAVASLVIRRILVDHARRGGSQKRGGGAETVPINEAIDQAAGRSLDLVKLDDALNLLRGMDERQCRVVEMKFFGGFEYQDIADALGVSLNTVKRDWASARAWLLRELK